MPRANDNLADAPSHFGDQWQRFLRDLVVAGLEHGLVAADAVSRATDAVDWIRANEGRLREGNQLRYLREFAIAVMRSQGVEGGGVLAPRAAEALRLMNAYITKRTKDRPKYKKPWQPMGGRP